MISSGYLVLTRDGKVLLSRRYQTGYEDGKYTLPAGHIEENETITQGTTREVREEIGIIVNACDLVLAHVMHRRSNDQRLDFFFTAKSWTGKPVNREQNKCDDLRWFPLNHLPENIIPYIHSAILAVQRHEYYSEFGWGEPS